MEVALIVPVLYNFDGFTKLMRSVDFPVLPIVLPNWETNIGVAAAWNDGLEKAMGADVAIVVNDDVEFHSGTIAMLADALDDFDLISAVAMPDPPRWSEEHGFPDFACFAVKPADFVEKFGMFDENFYPAYFEDNDMVYRIKLGGGRQGVHMSAGINHPGSVTQNWGGQRVVSHEKFESNRDYYVTKWGGRPHEEIYERPFNGISGKTYKDWTLLTTV